MSAAETLITEHLDSWTSAIKAKSSAGRGGGKKSEFYGIKKLRELILELAVRGLLVQQDAKDEPASESLRKIASKRSALLKEGKVKKQKKLPRITDSDKPFGIPSSWEWIRLGDATNYGISDKAEASDVDEDTWVLELEDVEKSTSRLLAKVRFRERNFRSSKNRFGKGDVIYGKLRPYLDKVLIADEPGVCTTEMIPVTPYSSISPAFLRLLMKAPNFIGYANDSTHGMNLPRIGTDLARAAMIPLAPESEQHRIVAKVDELMALCDQLEQEQTRSLDTQDTLVATLLGALTAASERGAFAEAWQRIASHFDTLFTTESSIDQLKQTILQLAVMGKLVEQDPEEKPASHLLKGLREEKNKLIKSKKAKDSGKMHQKAPETPAYSIPDSWEWVRFRELVWCYRGHNPPKSEFVYEQQEGYVRFVQITDFKSDKSAVYVPKSPKNKMVYEGEIIMAAYRHIGKLSRGMEGAFNVALCKILEFQPMNRDFVELMIGTDVVKGELLRASERGHIPSMHSDHLLSLLVPLPPLAEQQRIVAKVDELMALCDRLKARLQTAQATQLHLADTLVEQAVR